MSINEKKLKSNSKRELDVLKGVIDYADRMVYEDKNLNVLGGMADPTGYYQSSQVHLYKLLRKNAFAKTVVIETEYKGVLEFRLSPTEAVYPDTDSGYCTPHSNVGRLVTICHPGYVGTSRLWGDYRVLEVRSFDRFGGPEFEPNVRNFLQMLLDGDEGNSSVHDLRGFLARARVGKSTPGGIGKAVAPPLPRAKLASAVPQAEPDQIPPHELLIAQFTVVDDAEKFSSDVDIDDEPDWGADDAPVKQEEYFGLSERFFTHQTIEQNQIIARSPVGAMFVEGIAGSGKTSAALGRTKMLTTFNAAKISTKEEFYDVLGQDQDYWSADFAGQFSQESSIGFVRTGELIQYLQETCRRIDLPDLPVHEYKELQTRLREHRALARSATAGRRWTGLTQPREAHAATTMAWLHATEQAMSKKLAELLVENLPTITELSAAFEPAVRAKVDRVSSVALDAVKREFQELANELVQTPREGSFSLDRLAVRVLNRLDEVRKRVMGSKVIWTSVDGQTLFASDENSLARQLIAMKAALYFRSGQRLAFVDEHGLIDKGLTLLTLTGEAVQWGEGVREKMTAGQIVVRESSGKNVLAVASDINHLFIRLLPEATERIYVLTGGELRRLPSEHGWGRIKLAVIPVESSKSEAEPEDEEIETSGDGLVQGLQRNRTPDAEFKRIVAGRVLQPLGAIADLYLTTLKASAAAFPDVSLAKKLKIQLEQFKLADEDIDLLLCLSHLIGRGLKQGGLRRLQEPTFYQAVFVDEVQDFTEQQVYLMVEQANPKYRAVTVVGDTAQKLHHGSSIDLRACFPTQAVSHVRLTENLRQANMPGLAIFSSSFRSVLQNDEPPSDQLVEKARAQGDALVRPKFKICESDQAMDDRIIETLAQVKRNQTVAVLFPNKNAAEKVYKRLEQRLRENMIDSELSEKMNLARRHIRHFSDVAKSKGLEFDVVVLAGVDSYDLKNTSHVNHLYVGITRARSSLVLLTSRKQLAPELMKVRDLYQSLVGQPSKEHHKNSF
jgi:hypothetical protein